MARGGDDEDDDRGGPGFHGDQEGATPLDTPRTCTDCFWLVLFLVCCGGLCSVWSFAAQRGDIRWLSALPDSDGQLCGEEGRGHLLFVCGAAVEGGGLDLSRRACLDACPSSDVGDGALLSACPWPGAAYPSQAVAGLACLPTAPELRRLLGGSPYFGRALLVSEIGRAWPLLAGAAAVALVLSILYLCLLETCTVCLMFSGFLSLIAGVGALGAWLIRAWWNRGGAADGITDVSEMDWDLAAGFVCCIAAFGLLCMFLCHQGQFEVAGESVKEACECILEEPSLLLEPLLALACRAAVLLPLLVGLLWLLSCGRRSARAAATSDEVARPFLEFSAEEQLLIAYYVAMVLWIAELCHAVSLFVVAYTVEVWFFEEHQNKKAPPCCGGLCRAYCTGIEHHLGTLAFGALAVALLRPPRLVLGVLARAASDSENPLSECLGLCCGCCLSCFSLWVEVVNKCAYMDVAMNSTSFCVAAHHASEVLRHEAIAEIVLNWALPVLQISGIGGIAAASSGAAFLLARYWPLFADPSSDYYVRDPAMLSVACAVTGVLVAWPFLHIFDTVAETILYCIATEAGRKVGDDEDEDSGTHRFGCFGINCLGGRGESERLLG